MTNPFIPISVQAANKGVPVPVGKTAAEVRAMGFLVDQDIISDAVLMSDSGVDISEMYVEHSGGPTGFHWRRWRQWEEYYSVGRSFAGIRMWCGSVCAKMYILAFEKDPKSWRVGSHVEALGWVKGNVDHDLAIAQQEIDVMTTLVNSRMTSEDANWRVIVQEWKKDVGGGAKK